MRPRRTCDTKNCRYENLAMRCNDQLSRHALSAVRADLSDRRWVHLPGARSASGAAPEAPQAPP
eukprot:8980708-Pyramimonas_sp.AAC.1